MKPVLPILSALVLLLGSSPAIADGRDAPSVHARSDLRELAARICGGATLLAEVALSRPTQAFRARIRHFEDAVGRRNDVAGAWRAVRSDFEAARKRARYDNDQDIVFLISHLQRDFAEVDRLVGLYASASAPPSESTGGSSGRIIAEETGVGTVLTAETVARASTPQTSGGFSAFLWERTRATVQQGNSTSRGVLLACVILTGVVATVARFLVLGGAPVVLR